MVFLELGSVGFPSVVLQDAIDSAYTILPANLLAFGVGAAVVGNTDFVNTDFGNAGHLGGDFRLEAKAFFL